MQSFLISTPNPHRHGGRALQSALCKLIYFFKLKTCLQPLQPTINRDFATLNFGLSALVLPQNLPPSNLPPL